MSAGRLSVRSALSAALVLAVLGIAPKARGDDGSIAMGEPRWGHAAARFLDGRVIVVGGRPGDVGQTAEIFDPKTKAFAPTAPPLFGHGFSPLAVTLCDGRVLIVSEPSPQVAEIYDPATNTWIDAGHMKYGHMYGAITGLPDCRVLLVGGYAANNHAEIFDPAAMTFKKAGSMQNERFFPTATLLLDGRVLIAGGGIDALGHWYTWVSADIFESKPSADGLASTSWLPAGHMAWPRREHTATLLPDGRVLVVAGRFGGQADGTDGGTPTDTSEIFDPASGTFSTVESPLTTARATHSAVLLPNGIVLVLGGIDGTGSSTREVEGFREGRWETAPPLSSDRFLHTATLLEDGSVLVAGGLYQATAEIYRPRSDGTLCEIGVECASGFCAHGRCCGERCADGCRRCDVAGSEGVCWPICADETHTLGCASGNQSCAAETCVAVPCGPYVCDTSAGLCTAACGSVDDCAPGYACDSAGRCVEPPPAVAGNPGTCSATPERSGGWTGILAVFTVLAAVGGARRRLGQIDGSAPGAGPRTLWRYSNSV